jgi:Zn-dependent alcohol dehydrogenase
LRLDELVTPAYPLDKGSDAFSALASGQVARGVLAIA